MPTRKSLIKTILRLALIGFLLRSDWILTMYIGLPLTVTYSFAVIACALIAILGLAASRRPERFRPHGDAIRDGLEQIRFSLFSFAFVGVSDVWYKLDLVLSPLYWHWATWVIFGIQAYTLDLIASVEYPQLDATSRVISSLHKLLVWWTERLLDSMPHQVLHNFVSNGPHIPIPTIIRNLARWLIRFLRQSEP